jgi:hypothetical protein
MEKYRLYIDESGDHTYKHLDNLDTRYLGITGVLVQKQRYESHIQPELENLKRQIFKYDADNPPILVRSQIIHHKSWFYVLQNDELNKKWENGLLEYIKSLKGYTHIFTVVIDKKVHLDRYPSLTFDPYAYSLSVLLNRVRGYLVKIKEQADIVAEARGRVEDLKIINAFKTLCEKGSLYGTGNYYKQAYPKDELIMKCKVNNVAGLQIADLVAYGQKVQTIKENKCLFSRDLEGFTKKLNAEANSLVNQWGRYLLK